MNCSNCGHEIRESAQFCEYCGEKVIAQPKTPEETAREEIEAKCLKDYEKYEAKIKKGRRRRMFFWWIASLVFAVASVVFKYFSGDNWWRFLVFVSVPLAIVFFILGIKGRFTTKPGDKEELSRLSQAYENAKNDEITEK